jgi:energy-coupling factor transporter ATP-binding protein EcfA2
MKIKEISLKNFAKYDEVNVSFDDNVTYLVGKNGSGKSTLGITAIWFMFQGIAEKSSGGTNPLIGERFRFIGPKAATAKGEMILHDEKKGIDIKVIRRLTKTGSDLSFEAPEGYELGQQWLTDLFNIFLIAPKKFCELSPKDQAKALGIDTKKFDDEAADLKKKYTEINAVYRSMGELHEVEKVERVDIASLQDNKKGIIDKLNALYLENKKANEKLKSEWDAACKVVENECSAFNNAQIALENKIEQANALYSKLDGLGYTGYEVSDWIKSLGKPEEEKVFENYYPEQPTYIQELPDRFELDTIDAHILAAGETNNKALLYEQYIEKKQQKEAKEVELKGNKNKQAATETKRLDYIKTFKFPFSNITVGDDGELLLNGKPIKAEYFSTGELLKIIPVLIATTQPELKYVFLQDFNLMDEDKQKEIEEYLTGKGFQLVVEMVGKTKVAEKNCILLRDNVIVDSYEETKQPELI